ncbi:MAG: thermonuclease family protein [Gallionella sp.]|nr:thermonuclease family protein [Gallionella sp.]
MRYLNFTRFLLIGALLAPLLALGASIEGQIVGVSDGDTVTLLDAQKKQWKVRLLGIDAPEKKMPFGQRSKQHLADLVYRKSVIVEYSKRDRYGRTLGKIQVGGIDANLAQIRAGMAWHYKQYQSEQSFEDRQLYSEAEETARSSRRGLWADATPTPPWNWRKQQRTNK